MKNETIPHVKRTCTATFQVRLSDPLAPIPTCELSPEVTVSGGFVSGLNTIDFYVQGNGLWDGFALETVSFTANIPVPAPLLLLGTGLLGLLGIARRRN
jgi:hypothetical protein